MQQYSTWLYACRRGNAFADDSQAIEGDARANPVLSPVLTDASLTVGYYLEPRDKCGCLMGVVHEVIMKLCNHSKPTIQLYGLQILGLLIKY